MQLPAAPTALTPDTPDGASEAAVLTAIVEYGARCRALEAQLAAWIELARGWQSPAPPDGADGPCNALSFGRHEPAKDAR